MEFNARYPVLFEENTDEKHSIVIQGDFITHVTAEESQLSNSFRIFIRGVLDENSKAEAIFHNISRMCGLENKMISIYIFEEVDTISLIQLFCSYLNYVKHQKLTLETDKEHFKVANNQIVILKSFI